MRGLAALDVLTLAAGLTSHSSGGPVPKLCLREYSDLLSNTVRSVGRWVDCPGLARLWESLGQRSSGLGRFPGCRQEGRSTAEPPAPPRRLFVDVGANIGACLLPMLARPDVEEAVAFEPHPANLFYLTSAVLANPPGLGEKLSLFPVALGQSNASEPIYAEPGNAGNTVVGSSMGHTLPRVGQVPVRTLDDILLPSGWPAQPPPYIHLLKVDAQGSEVKILKGATKLLESGAINALKFELATDFLEAQGTEPAELFNLLLTHGYEIFGKGGRALSVGDLRAYACGPSLVEDFVAVRRDAGVGPHRKQQSVAC